MIDSSDLHKLSTIYSESVGLGPNGESSTGFGAPIATQIRVENEDEEKEERVVGKVVIWKNGAYLAIDQQGANVKLVMLTNPEVVAPLSDIKVSRVQPK